MSLSLSPFPPAFFPPLSLPFVVVSFDGTALGWGLVIASLLITVTVTASNYTVYLSFSLYHVLALCICTKYSVVYCTCIFFTIYLHLVFLYYALAACTFYHVRSPCIFVQCTCSLYFWTMYFYHVFCIMYLQPVLLYHLRSPCIFVQCIYSPYLCTMYLCPVFFYHVLPVSSFVPCTCTLYLCTT